MNRILALSLYDAKNIRREPMLLFVFISPLVIAIIMRFLLPFMQVFLLKQIQFDLQPYIPFASAFFFIMAPMLTGLLTGFLLLDEKDDHMMTVLVLTPLGKEGYLLYRILFPATVSFIYSILVIPIMNTVEIPLYLLIPIAILSSMAAPLIALFLSVMANNKVEGLTLSKALGIFMAAPFLDLFTDQNWRYIATLSPFYWTIKAFIKAVEKSGTYWYYIIGGLLIHVFLLWIILRRFDKRFMG